MEAKTLDWNSPIGPALKEPEPIGHNEYFYHDGSLWMLGNIQHKLYGKYRFRLTPRPAKTSDELAREYAQAFLANDISAGQLLTKLEGMK